MQGENLNGVKGWLAFFMVMFFIWGGVNVLLFFAYIATLLGGVTSAPVITGAIGSVVVGALEITTGVCIAMRKRLGRQMAYITTLAMAVMSIITNLVTMFTFLGSTDVSYSSSYVSYSFISTSDSMTISLYVGSIIISLVECGLIALYFYKSQRVKETLIEG